MTYGQFLKMMIENHDFTQTRLADELKLSRTYISGIISGTEKPPTAERCNQISKILSLTQKDSQQLFRLAMVERADEETRPIIEKSFSGSIIPFTEDPKDYAKVPLLGSCPASPKSWMADEIEGWHYFPKQVVKNRRLYLIRAKGDSMNKAGIDDGDLLVVEADREPENGSIVIFCIDHEYTVKKYHRSGTQFTLSPDSLNPKHQLTIYDSRKNEIMIRGVVDSIYMKKPR